MIRHAFGKNIVSLWQAIVTLPMSVLQSTTYAETNLWQSKKLEFLKTLYWQSAFLLKSDILNCLRTTTTQSAQHA